jgi:S-methylmethionine-dependent homocysteine/selenocysteine methylase
MTKEISNLPQLNQDLFLTDGGIETTLIFHKGFDLPHFAAFDLLRIKEGRKALVDYYESYLSVAKEQHLGFILETPTWRASNDWGKKIGYTADDIKAVNEDAIFLMKKIARRHEDHVSPIVVSGCIGPRGDGYDPGEVMTADEARHYHTHQVVAFKNAGADLITAITMTNVNEAMGIVQAAIEQNILVVISFTLETDGRLPTGMTIKEAVEIIDTTTKSGPAYYMINCAHPTHFDFVLPQGEAWVKRIRGIRANASCRSHQELDEAVDLDMGDPEELGKQYRDLRKLHPQITVLGGCCGTDHRHINSISKACAEAA